MIFIYLQILSIILLFLAYLVDRMDMKNPFIYIGLTVLSLLIIFGNTKFTKINITETVELPRKIEFPRDFNREGYIFTLGSLNHSTFPSPYYTSLYLARSGLYADLKTINGYTPLGYKNWAKVMGGDSPISQAANINKILDALLVPGESTNSCRANAWRISTFVLPEDAAQNNRRRLEKCGYHIGTDASAAPMAYASLPCGKTGGWEKLPPVSIPPLEGVVHESHEDAYDRLSLPERSEPVKLIFPRLYWHGFRATHNGKKIDVTHDESGILTSVTVPEGPAGTLEFWFFPETWSYMWVCPAFALIGLLCTGVYVRRRSSPGFWTPDLTR